MRIRHLQLRLSYYPKGRLMVALPIAAALGFMAAWLIAWSMVALSTVGGVSVHVTHRREDGSGEHNWPLAVLNARFPKPTTLLQADGLGLTWYSGTWIENRTRHNLEGIAAGWPFYCVYSLRQESYNFETNNLLETPPAVIRSPINWPLSNVPFSGIHWKRDMPLYFAPFSLTINALIYGTTIFLLWCGVRKFRTEYRRANNRCITCGYMLDRSVKRPCPECGEKS